MAEVISIERKELESLTLQLSDEEVRTLIAILSRVGGTSFSPRKYADQVYSALREASGYHHCRLREAGLIGKDNRIHFKEY